MLNPERTTEQRQMAFSHVARILFIVMLATGSIAIYLYRDQFDINELNVWVAQHPLTAPFLFIFLYVLLNSLFFPSPVLCLAGGILFGPVHGIIITQISAMLSAATTFTMGRYLSAGWMDKRLGEKAREIKHGVERLGWRFVLMLRLVPGLPYTLFNYALGTTRLRLLPFVSVTGLCILPRVAFMTYAGYTGSRAIAGREIGFEPMLILVILGVAIISSYLLKHLRQHGFS